MSTNTPEPNILPIRVAPSAVHEFIRVCMQKDAKQAIQDIAKALPGLTFRELALVLDGHAYFVEVEGGMRVVVKGVDDEGR